MESKQEQHQQRVTRLAPSPTGALHLGNARTFLVNWALARQNGWKVVLRIEDLDTPRVKPGVIELTVDLLAWLGIDWDTPPLIQSTQRAHHEAAMHKLASLGLVYPCLLSRAEIDAAASAPQEVAGASPEGVGAGRENVYPRHLRPEQRPTRFEDTFPSWRFAVGDEWVKFDDMVAGQQHHHPASSIGDFVVWTRRDLDKAGSMAKPGQAAYQLAVVVDDAMAGVTDVVRGDDLLDSAARQMMLYSALGVGSAPRYWHLPLVRGSDGRRLAKRHGDTRLDMYRARGVRAERVIALIARWCGIAGAGGGEGEMTAGEFRERLVVDTIPRSPVVFTAEDEAWLSHR